MRAIAVSLACCLFWAFAAPLPGAEAILIGAGDIAKCGSRLAGAEATAKLLDQFFAQPDAGPGQEQVEAVVFTVGDNVYPRGKAKEFTECYDPTWGRHKARTRPAAGNHDYRTRDGEAYFDYFGAAAGDPNKGYYSYDLGDWHIVVLNSQCKKAGGCGAGSPQHDWLVADLKASSARCTLAYMHHPLFSSGKHGGERPIRPLVEALYEAGAEVMLAGHEHNYERFAPQTPDGAANPDRGIQQFIVGTGGREHRRLRKTQPNSEISDNTSYGVLKLELHPDSYDWEFLPVAGASFRDSGSRKCH